MSILSMSARDCALAWQRWIDDPDGNAPPNPRADAGRARLAYKRAGGHLAREVKAGGRRAAPTIYDRPFTMLDKARLALRQVRAERKADPRPGERTTFTAWAQRETERQRRERRWQGYLP